LILCVGVAVRSSIQDLSLRHQTLLVVQRLCSSSQLWYRPE